METQQLASDIVAGRVNSLRPAASAVPVAPTRAAPAPVRCPVESDRLTLQLEEFGAEFQQAAAGATRFTRRMVNQAGAAMLAAAADRRRAQLEKIEQEMLADDLVLPQLPPVPAPHERVAA